MIRARRMLWSVPIAFAAALLVASPVSAHTVSGQSSTNFQTHVLAVTPGVPGLKVKAVELGSLLQVTWTGSGQLMIYGYTTDPLDHYLRLEPDGVYRNRVSPSTYLNATRYGTTYPPDASASATPVWVKISSGHTVLYHDHRTHWMGGILPPEVRSSPGTFHQVFPWMISMTANGVPVTVSGELVWIPPVSPWPWIALIAALVIVGAVGGRSRRWAAVLLGLTALIVLADVIHATGTGLDFAGSLGHRLLLIIGDSYYSVVAWALGIVAIRLLGRRSVDGLFAAVFTGLVIGIFGGLTDVTSLVHSQLPFDFGAVVGRMLVAVSIGGSAGAVLGAIFAYRANRAAPEPAVDASA